MKTIAVGDLIRDNLGRQGIVIEPARKPDRKWLAIQDDQRMRSAGGPWWRVCPLDGGSTLVPEVLAKRIRRAHVDDIAKVMESDSTDNGRKTLLALFDTVRSNMLTTSSKKSPTSRSKPTRVKRRAV